MARRQRCHAACLALLFAAGCKWRLHFPRARPARALHPLLALSPFLYFFVRPALPATTGDRDFGSCALRAPRAGAARAAALRGERLPRRELAVRCGSAEPVDASDGVESSASSRSASRSQSARMARASAPTSRETARLPTCASVLSLCSHLASSPLLPLSGTPPFSSRPAS